MPVTVGDLASRVDETALDEAGHPVEPLVVVDLDSNLDELAAAVSVAGRMAGRGAVLVGVAAKAVDSIVDPLVEQLDLTVSPMPSTDRRIVHADPDEVVAVIGDACARCPLAAVTAAGLLRMTSRLDILDGLLAESLAYSTLLAGPEFQRWRSERPVAEIPPATAPLVRIERNDGEMVITLNRPERRNAYSREMRDALVEALAVVDLDPSVSRAVLSGDGPAFCSGGDLDHFGTFPDPATAHVVRTVRSAAALIHRNRDRVEPHVHGACIGAGVELPSFASRIVAAADSFFQLPEVVMGLVPGAGGTVSLTARIGRWRTAYMALSGVRLDVGTALDWGLVDEVTA